MTFLFALSAIFFGGWVLAAASSSAAVFNPTVFTLSNGMQVVVVENHRAPIVTHMVWYKVGSADEPRGKSGIAHFLEHLMFKATKNTRSGEFSKIVARNGGRDNAFTSYDYTGYFQNVSADRLELVMKLEADRMRNLIIDEREIEPERQVVLEERRSRTENRPGGKLSEQVSAALYLNHPYRDPIIGWAHEIESITRDDLVDFYNRWYHPNNAILVVAGDVTPERVRELALKYYGFIPSGPVPERIRPTEPPHNAARRVILRDAQVRQPSFRRSYLAASNYFGDKSQIHALEVLAEIFGGGTTSQLYRSLVIDQKLAVSAGAGYDGSGFGPGGFFIFASPASGTSLEELEAAVDKEIQKIAQEGVAADDVARAKKRMLAGAIFARDSVGGGARSLGAALAAGQSIDSVENWPDRISQVSTADVTAAAKAVFVETNSVSGLLLGLEQEN